MADEDRTMGRMGHWVKNGQLLITVLTAGFSLYISVQQHTIKERLDDLTVEQQQIKTQQDALTLVVSRKAETEKFVERTLAYVEKLSISEAKQREAIIINLLDAVALATVSVEALGLIGKDDPRRTAMEALARASASRPLEALLEVYTLSEELNNADTLDHAIEQIGRIVRVMGRHPDPAQFREDDRVAPVIARLDALRTSLAAGAVTLGGDVVVAVRDPSPPDNPPAPPASVKSLIDGLKSPNTDTRRQSRQALADVTDSTERGQLLDELVAD